MQNYRAPDNTQPSGFSLYALSEQDIANGGARYLPAGSVAITDEDAEVIRTANNATLTSHQQMVESVMLGMKSKRLDIFRVLDTLQVDALTAGNLPNAQAIMQAKTAMTALNNIDLSAYQTSEQMEQAIQYAYWGIVSQSPQEVQDAFNALVPR